MLSTLEQPNGTSWTTAEGQERHVLHQPSNLFDMKLEIEELAFVKSAFDNVTIKASDAPGVAKIIDKLDREFVRLQKLQEAKAK